MNRRRKHRGRVERLEQRIALAVDMRNVNGVLLIIGDAADDHVHASFNPATDQLVVNADQGGQSFPVASIHEMAFFGNAGHDEFRNDTALPSRAFGGAGDDRFVGGGARDEFYGDYGLVSAEPITLTQLNAVRNNFGGVTAAGGAGGDFNSSGGVDILDLNLVRNFFGGAIDPSGFQHGNDALDGGLGDDELHGEAGDDTLDGREGIDVLLGGKGADYLLGGASDDFLDGGEGDDQLFGEAGEDALECGPGDDFASGGEGNDGLVGGDGTDYLIGGLGDDALTAVTGDDTLVGEVDMDSPVNLHDTFGVGDGEVTVVGDFDPVPDETGGEGFGLAGKPRVNFDAIFSGQWSAAQQAAAEHALAIWENVLVASYAGETVHVRFQHKELPAGVLLSTRRPRDVVDGVSFSTALANHMARQDLHPSHEELTISMPANPADDWYYGTDGLGPDDEFDFVTVVLHEVAHGLGFDSNDLLTEYSAPEPCRVGQVCIDASHITISRYAELIERRPSGAPSKLLSEMTKQEFNAARVSGELVWVGGEAVDQNEGGEIRIYAPSSFEKGSSLSHVDPQTVNNSTPSQEFLMYPEIDSGVALRLSATEGGMLADLGWDVDYARLIDSPGDVTGSGANMQTVTGDFDGDGDADIAIGMPEADVDAIDEAGAVAILISTPAGGAGGKPLLWHQAANGGYSVKGVAEPADHFGRALAAGDFNGDGFDDLAVGVPDEDIGDNGDAGAVNVIYGSSGGLETFGNVVIDQNDGVDFGEIRGAAESGDRFGASLSVGDYNGDGYDDLAIGAPDENVGATQDAGAVNVVYGGPSGLTPAGNQLIDQNGGVDFGDIRGSAEAGDRFGFSLAAGDFNHDGIDDLAIGAANEDIGQISDAGAVNIVFGALGAMTPAGNYIIDQNGGVGFGDIAGDSEADDQFGAALAAGDFNADGIDDLVIGAPGEDIGDTNGAGAVNVILGNAFGLALEGNFLVDQDGGLGFGDIRGVVEANDRFGGSLATGDFNHDGYRDVAIGVAGENIENVSNAGAVNVVLGGPAGLSTSGNFLIDQNGGVGFDDLRGKAESADLFGASLAAGDLNADGWVDLVIAAPGEDIGDLNNRGAINVVYSGPGGLWPNGNELWYLD